MKVLMLHPHDIEYDPWTIRIIKLAQSLKSMGHEVTVAYLESIWRKLPEKIKLRDVPDDGIPYVRLLPRGRHMWKNFQTIKNLAESVDIIHFQKCFASTALPALYISSYLDKPVHYDWDDYEEEILKTINDGIIGRAFRSEVALFERTLPSLVDGLSAASDAIRELAVERGFPEKYIVKTPVGADLVQFHPDNDGTLLRADSRYNIGNSPMVLYLGQLEGAAYVETFLQAALTVKKSFPGAKFVVVGGGILLKKLKKLAVQLNLDEEVIFTGYIPSNEVPKFVAAADVAIACLDDYPNTRCKSPLKIAEYMAAGKAIVASNVGEVSWMLQGSGIIIPPSESESLATGIKTFLNNPEIAKELGAQARRRAEKYFNWHWSAEQLEIAYQNTLDRWYEKNSNY